MKRPIQGHLTLVNSALVGNSARTAAGGYVEEGSFTAENSTITANAAVDEGGGIYALAPVVPNNTIVAGNTAFTAPDVRADSLSGSHNLLGVGDGQTAFEDGLDGNLIGTATEPIDPRFVRAPSAGADRLWGTSDDDYGDLRLRVDSPAIDAGDNNLLPADTADLDGDGDTSEPIPLDFAGNSRIDRWTVDIGACEHRFVFGDLNRDGRVGAADLDLVRSLWGQPSPEGGLFTGNPADPSSGVGSADLELVRAFWGEIDPTESAVDAVFAGAGEAGEKGLPAAANAGESGEKGLPAAAGAGVDEAGSSKVADRNISKVFESMRAEAAWAMAQTPKRRPDPVANAHDAWLCELARLR